MTLKEVSASERIIAERNRHVARGVATTPLVVARADGARLWDVDGREYIDFAGGLGSHNLGHGFSSAVAAMHEQIDRFLHQCFMVALYEPYIDVCARLGELSPCAGEEQKTLLVNSGAEAVENAVKIARAATGRPAVLVFDNAFHGRTLLTLTMSAKLVYRRGFAPFAPEVYRAPAPYPYRGVSTKRALAALESLFVAQLDPETVACAVVEPVQGEGGFIPMPSDYLATLAALCREHGILLVADEIQTGLGRTGRVWAVEHHGVEPDLLVSGKSLGGGLPLAAVTGRAEVLDAVGPGGLGGTFGGNPVACAAAVAVLEEVASPAFRARSEEVGKLLREGLDGIAERVGIVGEVRGLGPMLALELVTDRVSREPASDLAAAATAVARERGLVILSCGLYGNVLRILVPLVASDDDLGRGLEILEESLVAVTTREAE